MHSQPRELKSEEIMLNVEIPEDWEKHSDPEDTRWAVIGQDRAVQALEMGVSIKAKGYNIYAAGESGTGKHTAILDILSRHREKNGNLRDIVYVQDFKEPDKPLTLSFPEGKARVFKEDIKQLIERLRKRITEDLEKESYKDRRDSLLAETENMENKVLSDFESKLNNAGFRTVQTSDEEEGEATDIAPVINGETIPFEDLQDLVATGRLPESLWKTTREQYFSFMDEMKRIYRDLRSAREKLEKSLRKLKRETIQPGIHRECSLLSGKWDIAEVKKYISSLETDILENSDWFTLEQDEIEEADLTVRYGVNIVIDRYGIKELPVIHETNPTKTNLFGAIEARYDVSGELKTNMMMIKAGSLVKADGGYIILQAEDIFSKEGLWNELKRALQTGHVVPEVQSSPLGPLPILMQPQPIEFNTTVIMVGPAAIYETLCAQDEEFMKLFKIAAEFSSVMKREKSAELEYASFAKELSSKENLFPITRDGIKEIISYGIFLSEKRNRLSTRFSLIGDLIRESNYKAEKNGEKIISGETVKQAIASRKYQGNLPEEMLIDQIKEGTLLIDVQGKKTGVVNGLAVLERGFYSFGTPLRITASVGPGKDGLINIERESGLSGELHDKGVYLLEGYLRHRYARRFPLSMSAGIAIEQSYYEIDGDSASAAELAALLSAISGIPLRQDIAVTGAVNQLGILQPVGGIHEKINGFYKTCRAKGFTGTQGVIVPAANINSVILTDEIIKAVRKNMFHIWTADNIDQVMSLLSGRKPGREKRNGKFEKFSINEEIRINLQELSELSQ